MVNELEEGTRQATPPGVWRSISGSNGTASPSHVQYAKPPSSSPTQLANDIILNNTKGAIGRQFRVSRGGYQNGRTARSPAQEALSDPKILDTVFAQLWDDLLIHGREARQSHFRNLTVVAKSWLEPASQWLWMYVLLSLWICQITLRSNFRPLDVTFFTCTSCRNPYFGTARRASKLEDCLTQHPHRGLHIRKLIFGEGSSTDIMDWVTKHNVPNLLRAAPNVQVVGIGGLRNVHLDDFRQTLQSRPLLEEVRACGEHFL